MVRTRIAAIVALSLLGVVPAGMAWADPKDKPNNCKNETPKKKNPNCRSNAKDRPGQRTGQQPPPTSKTAEPEYLIDTDLELRTRSEPAPRPVRIQAIEESRSDNDHLPDDGGRLLSIDNGETLEVRASSHHKWISATSAEADAAAMATEDSVHVKFRDSTIVLEP